MLLKRVFKINNIDVNKIAGNLILYSFLIIAKLSIKLEGFIDYSILLSVFIFGELIILVVLLWSFFNFYYINSLIVYGILFNLI